MDNLQGTLLKGYKLEERIGSGGFGAVYRARQTTVGREVAVKIILPGYANNPDFIRRFESEAQLVARLEHPHITPLHDYWRDPSGAYLVMRYLRGGNVRHSLEKQAYELVSISHLLDQIASALDFAHRNAVIHRDIKPDNILLDEDGNAYLADFGIAKDLTGRRENQTGVDAVVGSLDYISPEQARNEQVTPRTDIYSLGVTLYEMITGEHPFVGASTVERLYKHINEPLPEIENLPDSVRDTINVIIQKATAKDPDKRYEDVLALAVAFREGIGRDSTTTSANLVEQLTLREQEILSLIANGKSNQEIAEYLVVTVGTVKWHITQLYKKLSVRSRVQAIVRGRELNLIVARGINDDWDVNASTNSAISLPELENPYKGLHAFQIADSRDFFGRDELINKLIARMRANDVYHRFLAVVGPSGSGKSSLVKAGLIPALWRGAIAGSEKWFVVDMIPGTHPIDKLESALIRVAANQAHNLREQLQRDERGLSRIADIILPGDDTELVIVVDQFEEVFTLVEDEAMRQHFLNLLCAAVSDVRSRIRVVITLRADYYDRPLHYPDFGQLVRSQMETILPLSAKGLERAIRGPAERVGVSFEQGLVEQIVSQMNYQAGALPLLQYALTELFDRREGRLLTNRAYQEIGGAVGALANRADEIYRSLSPDAQELAHQMFMRMVTLGEGAEDTRRRANQSELLSLTSNTDLMEEIIDQFAAYRLLSLDHDPLTRQPTVEVAHEAILREWERLRQWLNESRTEIRLQQQLNHMASEWRNARQDTSFLMHGSRLEQFEAWAKQTQLVLTPHEQQFLQESLEQRNSLAIQERERQVREEAQEKRSRTLLRALVAVFALATILSGGLAIFALDRGNVALAAQAQIATEQANTLDALDIAQRSGLAFAANAAIELNDIDLAVALVNESAGDHSDILPETLRVAEKLAQTGGPSLVVDTQQVCWGHISLDARYYIASDCGSYMSIFEMATGQMVFENTFEATPTQFNFSADSSYFLTSTDNLNYTLWDVATWQVINQLTIEKNGTLPLNYVGDSPLVAFLEVPDERMSDYENGFETSGNAFAIYDMALGIFVKRIEFPNEFLSWINFSQDGSLGVVGGFASNEGPGRQHYRLIVFDVMSGDILNTIDLPHNQNEDQNYAATWIAFSPDNTSLYLSGEPNYFINWQSGEIIDSFSIASDVRTGYPDRTLRYVTYQDDATQDRVMRYLATGEEIRFQNFASIAPTNIPNHILVKYHGRLHEYVLWDVLGQDTNSTTLDYPLSVTAVDFNPRGTQFIAVSNAWGTGTDTGTSTIFDANTLEEIRHLDTGLNLGFDVAWSPDGKLIATTTFADGVFLWDAQTGERLHVLDDIPDDSVYFVEFTYDSRYILSGQGTFVSTFTSNEIASLYMWDTASGELVKRIELPVETVPHWGLQMIEASPVENIVYVSVGTVFVPGGIGATYRTFRINLDTLEIVELSFGFNMLWSDFTPDGEYWITSSFVGNDIIVVDVATNEIVRSWQTLENDIWGVSMSSDGTMLATGSGVQSVETIVSLWDFETGTLIRRYLGHTEQAFMLDVTFRPDGTQIASTAFDRTLRIWDVDRLSTLNWLSENRFLREFTCSERIQYRIEPYCEE